MAEWSNALVLKTSELNGSVSSNLTLSTIWTGNSGVESPAHNGLVLGSNPSLSTIPYSQGNNMLALFTPGKIKIAVNVLILVGSILYEVNAHKQRGV